MAELKPITADEVRAAIEQGAHHGEYAERVVSLQFLRRVLAVMDAALAEPTAAEIETFFEIYAADVRYEPADHPRMLWLMTRALTAFLTARKGKTL